ncbi:MAG: DUF3990 domain-containing protein [Lachnospiraceae bacterium]|nr:DUF3990 domain-containing protein [Lachnospiraceae bacterium]
MIIYHGSDHIIQKPEFHAGNRHNDYGYGFYCTEHEDTAREWSVSAGRSGYINIYDINLQGLSVLDLDEFPILTWLTVLLENRTFNLASPLALEAKEYLKKEFSIEYGSFDIIKGYRADDSYFSFAQDFLNGTIPVSQLARAMKLGGPGEQIVLKRRRTFERIRYKGADPVDHLIWYPRRRNRDEQARKAYLSSDKMSYIRGDIYITRIIDEEIKRDDARIQ